MEPLRRPVRPHPRQGERMKTRRVTGVTVQQQRLIARAVKNAREMALLPYASRPSA
ncbi:bS18 family ribosomal protein [Nonomuraea pusilla]|uniref:bS18 family ribosomal protein n=1 Tax=Nonomuraea pusilla TaxID=46177 RepID=UPI003321F7F0